MAHRGKVPSRKVTSVKKKGNETVCFENITPAIAQQYLGKNLYSQSNPGGVKGGYSQREVRPAVIKAYARFMLNHDWPVTHQGIAFDWNGNLLDGQHRLHAIIECGRTIRMQVTKNLDPEAFKYVDRGVNRNAGDFLSILSNNRVGKTKANAMCQVARSMLGGVSLKSKKWADITVADYANMHFNLIDTMMKNLGPLDGKKCFAGVAGAFCNAAISCGDENFIFDSANRWRSENWNINDPIKAAKRAIRLARNKYKEDGKSKQHDVYYRLCIHGLKFEIDGKGLRRCQESKEDFQLPPTEEALRCT